MNPAHQAIAGGGHEEHPGQHTTGVVHPERGAESKGPGEIFEACILQDRKRVTGKDFEHHHRNERHHEQRKNLACPVIDDIYGRGYRALPGRHILRRLTGRLGTSLRDQFVRNLEFFRIYLEFFWVCLVFGHPHFPLVFIAHFGLSNLRNPSKTQSFLKSGQAPSGNFEARPWRASHRSLFYFLSVAACARPKFALEVCAPAQNGTTVSAKSFCDCQTSAKNLFSAAAFSSDFLAAAMYSVK